jgi:acetyl esterase
MACQYAAAAMHAALDTRSTDPASLLSPAMRDVLQRIRRANVPAFHTLSPDDARAAYLQAAEILDLPRAPLSRVEDVQVPGASSALASRLYTPSREPGLPLLLYLHGGGFVIGGIETHDSLCRQLARLSGGAVLSLDYRLAPEHRFPAAHDDTWAVLRWLHERGAASLGLDATRLAVGGDSAGGTLAAAVAIEARDAGLPLALQLLITPGVQADAAFPSRERFASGFLLESVGIDWFFDHAIDRAQRSDWRFSPLNAGDLGGVAPACVIVAECDPLADENVAYADRLRAAGVPLHFELARGVTHDFIKMGRALKEGVAAQRFAAAALAHAWRNDRT